MFEQLGLLDELMAISFTSPGMHVYGENMKKMAYRGNDSIKETYAPLSSFFFFFVDRLSVVDIVVFVMVLPSFVVFLAQLSFSFRLATGFEC